MRFGDNLFMELGKDGGPKSRVDGYWLIRAKKLFTVAVLRFAQGTREAFHSHAFDSVSWVLRGSLVEVMLDGEVRFHSASPFPVLTRRDTFHKVYGVDPANWVLTFRGPWSDRWQEVDESGDAVVLTHDRVELKRNGAVVERKA